MKTEKHNSALSFLLFQCITAMSLITSVLFIVPNKYEQGKNITKAEAAPITQGEASTENVDSLRYGYNVTSGRAIFDDGLVTSAPILDDISKGLYQYISKHENNGKTEAGNFIGYDAISVAKQSGKLLSGGTNANIQFVALNIDSSFDRNSNITEAYAERYETYYQQINRVYYIIQDVIDLRDYLSTNFKADLLRVSSENDAKILFNKYGTHLFTGFQYGGMMQVTNYIKTKSTSVEVSQVQSLSSKMNATYGGYGGGTSFSFAEQYTTLEQKSFGTSNYKVAMFGGESVTAISLDQLFTYNPSYLDGKGNYIYDRWVNSINNGTRMSIIGTPASSRAIPLWDFLPDDGEYSILKSNLISAYSQICGDKYDEYLAKYPTTPRVIGNEEVSSGVADIKGYSLTFKNNTVYYLDGDNTSGKYNVFRDATIQMNYTDNIPAGLKEWKITKSNSNATILDKINGVFVVNQSASSESTFTIGLYSGSKLLFNREFTIKQDMFSGGDGEINPYLISTKSDFKTLINNSNYWGKKFKLTTNIDLANETISGIGLFNNQFSGTFDGNYCTIKNVKLTSRDSSIGLFAYNSGTIKNLFLDGVSAEQIAISSTENNVPVKYAAALVGYNTGKVINCNLINIKVDIKYYATNNDFEIFAGSVVGYSADKNGVSSTIEKCYADIVSVKAICNNGTSTNPGDKKINVYVGGLLGYGKKTNISNCALKTINLVHGQSIGGIVKSHVGGFLGAANDTTLISNCIVGNPETIYSAFRSKGQSECTYNSFLGYNDGVKITDSYVKKSSYVTGGDASTLLVKDTITLTSCNTLSTEHWTSDKNDQFPILKDQQFLPTNALFINTDNAETIFYYGQEFNIAGIVVEANYANGGSKIPVDAFSYDASNYNKNVIGSYPITIYAMGFEKTYYVMVRKLKVIGIELSANGQVFHVGDSLDTTQYNVSYVLENGERVLTTEVARDYIEYPTNNITITSTDYVLGENKVDAKCGNMTSSTIITATEKVVQKLDIINQPNEAVYYEGQYINVNDYSFEVTYYDGSSKIVSNNEIEVIGGKLSRGQREVIFAYADYTTCSLAVDVQEIPKSEFLVEFIDFDGRVISSQIYEEGDIITIPSNPTRASDNTFIYTFAGWDKEVSLTCQGAATYTAVYTNEYIDYVITFQNYDGTILLTSTYHYGDTIVYPIDIPIREDDDSFTYTFIGWDKTTTTVSGDMAFIAQFDSNPKDGDDSVALFKESVAGLSSITDKGELFEAISHSLTLYNTIKDKNSVKSEYSVLQYYIELYNTYAEQTNLSHLGAIETTIFVMSSSVLTMSVLAAVLTFIKKGLLK